MPQPQPSPPLPPLYVDLRHEVSTEASGILCSLRFMLVILRDGPEQVQRLTVRQGVAQRMIVGHLAFVDDGRKFPDAARLQSDDLGR